MEVPAYVLGAVRNASIDDSRRIRSSKSARSLVSSFIPRSPYHNAQSSAEDISTTSDSELDHGYQTDFTTPANSDACNEDMQPDDVEDFRDREYPQLKGKTYLDHGGTTLYAKSLIEEFSADLISNLYGNPHSASSPSALAGHRVDAVRERALRFFNADPDEFDLVFTANATAAIKLVIDCFKDHAASSNTPVWYGYHRDAHTSFVGAREATKMHRCFTSDEEVDVWVNSGGLGGPRARQLGLFSYPGQSNMTGRRLPTSWPGRIRKLFHKAPTYTIMDAAALASTAPLDLSDPATAPDFVALSFYKIFGFPNIGALIVRKDSAHVLQSRKYYGGGTVEMVIVINDNWHAKKDTSLHDRLEDGTLPFHSIFALDHAMNVHERLYGPNPMKFISHHTSQLGKKLYEGVSRLQHANGVPLCRIYKDDSAIYGDPSVQGATIAFNVQNADRSLVGFEDVEEAADDRNIFVRSGSLCNPGGMATYLDWSPAEMKAAYAAGHRCSNPTQVVLGKPTGVVRVSLGAMSTAGDVTTLVRFLETVYLDKVVRARSKRNPVSMHFDQATLAVRTLSMAATSPGSLSIPVPPGSPYGAPQSVHSFHEIPSSTSSSKDNENVVWDFPNSGMLQQPPISIDLAKPKNRPFTSADLVKPNPPFIPADYVKLRKPWEEEMRKQQYASTNMEIKVRDLDDNNSTSRVPTPSVKARKFGRSVVNLLRAKSHAPPDNSPEKPSPSPALPADTTRETKNPSVRSRRSMEKAQFAHNVEALGM